MELNLTWEPPTDDGGSDITGYFVQWTANRRAKPFEHMIDDPTLRSHTIAGLQNTTAANPVAYYVWITAINAFGESTLTLTPNGKPVSPATVGAPGTNGTTDVGVGTHTHIVTGLASGAYVAKVSACNAIGCTFEVLSSYDTSTQSGDTVTVP